MNPRCSTGTETISPYPHVTLLKLRPYGSIEMCVLLLLWFWPDSKIYNPVHPRPHWLESTP